MHLTFALAHVSQAREARGVGGSTLENPSTGAGCGALSAAPAILATLLLAKLYGDYEMQVCNNQLTEILLLASRIWDGGVGTIERI